MSAEDEYEYFKLRQEGKVYISKLFHWNAQDVIGKRNIHMVLENNDSLRVGEIEGSMCLRLTGEKKKTQVSAIVTQDDHQIRRLTLQTFKPRAGEWIEAVEKEEFTFRQDEFLRLLEFLNHIKYVDLSNQGGFHIQDISTQSGAKIILDAPDTDVLQAIKRMPNEQRKNFLDGLKSTLTSEEVNILLGRKQGLSEFERHLHANDWLETDWQDFFEKEQWVFGYGLDYRILRHFDREMTVGAGGTDNKDKPVVDFLETFRDYTVLVEIKRPNTPIFKTTRGGRSGTWDFSADFISAVSQIVEQKAEWLAFAQAGEHYNRAGTEKLTARTRNAKAMLVIGSQKEFSSNNNRREADIQRDTFELFRQELRGIDVLTFDELLDRAKFITTD